MSNSGDNTLSSTVSLELVNMLLFLHHQCSADTALDFTMIIGIPLSWCYFIRGALLLPQREAGGAVLLSALCKPVHFYLPTRNFLFFTREGRRKLRSNKRRGKLPDSSLPYCWEVQLKKKKEWKKEWGMRTREVKREKKKDLTGRRNKKI